MGFLTKLLGKAMGGAPSAGSDDPREVMRPVYAALVGAARDPGWYRDGGVADSKPGRFDMLTTLLALLLLRLEQDGGQPRQSTWLSELFIDDMDAQLREDGVGDLMVGKHVTRLMGTLGGRLGALREALAAADQMAALADYATRNVTGDEALRSVLAAMLAAWYDRLAASEAGAVLAGRFPSP